MWTQHAFTLDITFLNMLLMMTYLLSAHTHTQACMYTHVHARMCAHTQTHAHACVHTHTHTRTHACMHTYTNVFLIPFPDLSVICLIFLALIRNEAVCCQWRWLSLWWKTQLCRVSHLKKSGLTSFFTLNIYAEHATCPLPHGSRKGMTSSLLVFYCCCSALLDWTYAWNNFLSSVLIFSVII